MTLFKKLLPLVLLFGCTSLVAEELPAHISMFNDSIGSQTIESLLKTPDLFTTCKDRSPNLAFANTTLWVKVELPEHQDQVVVTIENAHLDYLDCFIYQGDSLVRTFKTGDLRNFSTRDLSSNFFSFICTSGEQTLYFKANTKGSLAVPLRIHTLKNYFGYERANQMSVWMFIGIALVALSANVLFYIILKDQSYMYYSLYVLSNFVYAATDVELSFQYLWPNHPEWNKLNLLFYSFNVFTLVFCNHFLEAKKHHPVLHKFNLTIIAFQVLGGFYSLIDYKTGALISAYSFILVPFFIFFSAIVIYLKTKKKVILMFLGAWSLYLIGVTVYLSSVLGISEYYSSISNIIFVSSSVEMILVFVIVVYNISLIREENVFTKSQIIHLLTEKEKILEQQNHLLEVKVEQRTKDLQVKNEEISSQNEEIVSQNEELFTKQELLEHQNQLISLTNKELNEYKEHLEEIVEKRTLEIKHVNHDLAQKNKQLEQFAFMAAHNLRSPVATILGLTSIMEEDQAPDTQREVVKRISASMRKLDVIVKSLSSILRDPKVSLKLFEECDLDELAKESMDILQTEIADSKAEVVTNFVACTKISAVKAYLHNLFYNMMSNAIKYRKPNAGVRIEIESKKANSSIVLTFKDNGLGIDMASHGNEIFMPFKRFNAHIDGAGVGLYLIKTQIEALGGSIKVESTLGIGTTFSVTLPDTIG